MKTGAVIIAAGHKSTISRFQPMLPVGDSTVIRRIIITLKRAGIDPVVVVTGQKADEVENILPDFGSSACATRIMSRLRCITASVWG